MTTRRPSTSPDPTTAYARDVVEGRVVAGPHVRNSCRRHLDDLERGHERGLTWDLDSANRAINFFPDVLRLNGGQFEGKPFKLHPSQQFKAGSIFGWKRADGTRRFRRAYMEEGKGNGKSPFAAGVGMYCLLADGEPRAEVYAAAADKDQAMVLFRDAVAMREQSPALAKRLIPSGGNPVWQLRDPKTGSFYKPISSEKKKAGSGPRPSCALCDEIHEHPDRLTVEMLERGFKFRRNPLLLMATNAGFDRNSVAWEEREHAVRVAAGTKEVDKYGTYVGEVIDDSTFSYVCSLDHGEDPLEDESCWVKANPLLGTILSYEYLRDNVNQAKSIPGRMNNILRLHFCVWTDSAEAWMSRVALEKVLEPFDPIIHVGKKVYASSDLSATQDLTAVGHVVHTGFREVQREVKGELVKIQAPTFDAWIEAWTPKETLAARALRDKAPYDVWAREGHLRLSDGPVVNYDEVAAYLVQSGYEIVGLAYDRWAFRSRFEPAAAAVGLKVPFIEHPQGGKKRGAVPEEFKVMAKALGEDEPQGLWMPGSLADAEQLIFEQRIRIKASPVIISAVMSAMLASDAFGNKWLSKIKSTNRIDAAVALLMAIGLATMMPIIPDTTMRVVYQKGDMFL